MITTKNISTTTSVFLKLIFFITLIVITSNTIIYFSEKFIFGERFLFDDLLMNYCAGKIYSVGISPYGFGLGGKTPIPLIECMKNIIGNDWGMPVYLYSPSYLKILSSISILDFNFVKKVWILISCISIFLIMFFSYKIFPIKKFKIIYPLIIYFSFGGILVNALKTGNVSNIIYGLLALSIFFLYKNYKIIFSLIIILLSLIKPHFFIFIFLGLFIYEKKFIKHIIISFLAIISCYLYYFLFETELFLEFLKNLQVINTREYYFSFNYTVGLKSIIESLPTNFANLFNFYILAGPSLLKNVIWLFFLFFIVTGTIFYRSSLKINNLNNENKKKLIALGSIIALLINPNVTIYDFYLFVPSIFYLINNTKFHNLPINLSLFRYILIMVCIVVQDINLPFFLATIFYFYIIFYLFKKKIDVLNFIKK